MSNQRFTPEFKDEVVRQIVDRGDSVLDVVERLDVSQHGRYKWVKAVKPDKTKEQAAQLIEVMSGVQKRLAQLRRTEEERDIPKKAVLDSMKPTLTKELVLDTLLMAVWRRRPTERVIVHSDHGSQYGSDDWLRSCCDNNLQPSMNRRGNCWDNAVAESFFSSLKKKRFRRRIYKTRDLARPDVFNYIDMFYNRSRRYSHLGGVRPEAFERASFCGFRVSMILGEVQPTGRAASNPVSYLRTF